MGNIVGERLETSDLSQNTSEHLHRYTIAKKFVKGKTVLDIASGEGYGSNLLSQDAIQVIGVDIDPDAVERANLKYSKINLKFKQGDAALIPCENEIFDVVVSFETLEHHDKHEEMMLEIKRVLKPEGIFIISTPNKLVYTDRRNYKNPFHVKELYKEEFDQLLSRYFSKVVIYKQRFFSGSFITPDESTQIGQIITYTGNFNNIQQHESIESEYLIGIASSFEKVQIETSLFIDEDFQKKNVEYFKNHSIRYKVGYLVLSPGRILKSLFKK